MTLNLFYLFSFISVFAALLVVFSKNPVHSALYLVIALMSIACHYVLLSSEFLAGVHVIVYTGAIMVLFLFVIMHLNLNTETEPHKSTLLKFAATICGGLFVIVLVASLRGADLMTQRQIGDGQIGFVKNLGKILFTEFLLPFELASILLLAAMVGAVMLGKPEEERK